MFQWLTSMLRDHEDHEPCQMHQEESAGLRSQLHGYHDRQNLLGNTIAQLRADNQRLIQENHTLRHSQQQDIIADLADRIIEQKLRRETPSVSLPCPHHSTAGITFMAAA